MRSRAPKIFALVGVGILLLLTIDAAFWVSDTSERQWGPFTGVVVDAETGEPIAGAIFMVTWMRAIPPNNQMFDEARIAVTDREGRFEIPRRDPPYFADFVMGVLLACMAPGYQPYERGWKSQEPIVRMQRLGAGQPTGFGLSGDLVTLPYAKRREFSDRANEIRRQMGLAPWDLVSGKF